MKDNLSTQIYDAIKANLPAQMGETLQCEFERLQKIESQHEILKEKYEQQSEVINDYRKKESKYAELEKRELYLKTFENDLKDKERNLKIQELESQLNTERSKSEFMNAVTMGLVRNTEFKKDVFHNRSIPVADSYGGTTYHNETDSQTEIQKVE